MPAEELPLIRLDLAGRRAWLGDRPLRLSRREFDLLAVLAAREGEVVRIPELRAVVWGGRDITRSAITLRVHRLRAHLDDPPPHRYIATVPRVGYRLNEGTVNHEEWKTVLTGVPSTTAGLRAFIDRRASQIAEKWSKTLEKRAAALRQQLETERRRRADEVAALHRRIAELEGELAAARATAAAAGEPAGSPRGGVDR